MIPLIAASLIGAAGGIIGGGMNALSQHSANQTNVQLMRESNQWNERLMREAWARDDEAVQRRVRDLQAAGLHPSLASGGGQSSSPIHVGAAQVDSVRSGDIALQAIENANIAANMTHIHEQNQLLKAQQIQTAATTRKTLAETDAIMSKTPFTAAQLKALSQSTNIAAQQEVRDQARHEFDIEKDRYNLNIYKELNLPTGTDLGLIQKLETIAGFLTRLVEKEPAKFLMDTTDNLFQSTTQPVVEKVLNAINNAFPNITTNYDEYVQMTEEWIREIENGRTPNGFERMFMGQELQNRGITPQSQSIRRQQDLSID